MNTSTRKEDRIRSRRGRRGYHAATGPRCGAPPARSGRKPGAGRGGERAGPGLADNAAGRGEAEATAILAPASPCGFWEVRGSGNGDVSRAARECGTARHGTAASGAEGEGGRRGVAGLGYIRGAGRCFPCFVATRTAEGTGCLLAGRQAAAELSGFGTPEGGALRWLRAGDGEELHDFLFLKGCELQD